MRFSEIALPAQTTSGSAIEKTLIDLGIPDREPAGASRDFAMSRAARQSILNLREGVEATEIRYNLFEGRLDPAHRLAVVDSLGRPDLSVSSPFHVELHREPEEVSALHRDTGIFGYGDTEAEALEDFRAAVADLYLCLDRDRGSLSPALRSVLASLNSKLRRV